MEEAATARERRAIRLVPVGMVWLWRGWVGDPSLSVHTSPNWVLSWLSCSMESLLRSISRSPVTVAMACLLAAAAAAGWGGVRTRGACVGVVWVSGGRGRVEKKN